MRNNQYVGVCLLATNLVGCGTEELPSVPRGAGADAVSKDSGAASAPVAENAKGKPPPPTVRLHPAN
jgi:hypothetical protein